MISDPGFWANDFRTTQRERIATFRTVVQSKILPAFANLHDEAEEFEARERERLSALEPYGEDPVAVAEIAFENSAQWYVTMSSLGQGMTSLLATALSHLFEQMLLEFYALEFVHSRPVQWDRKITTVLERLETEGVACKRFRSWPKIHELAKVAGAVKHGEGHSADELRALRPDLFVHPNDRATGTAAPSSLALMIPALGEGLYVTPSDLSTYFDVADLFCAEMARALEGLSRRDIRRKNAIEE